MGLKWLWLQPLWLASARGSRSGSNCTCSSPRPALSLLSRDLPAIHCQVLQQNTRTTTTRTEVLRQHSTTVPVVAHTLCPYGNCQQQKIPTPIPIQQQQQELRYYDSNNHKSLSRPVLTLSLSPNHPGGANKMTTTRAMTQLGF